MSEEKEALGRRVMACSGFRWMKGMVAMSGHAVAATYGDGAVRLGDMVYMPPLKEGDGWMQMDPRRQVSAATAPIPDLSNPATVGCLLALVRDRPGWQSAYTAPTSRTTWGLFTDDIPAIFEGANEVEALVVALESIDKKGGEE